MSGDGSWCLIWFRHPSWLGIVIGGCHKCFQHHLLKNHLDWVMLQVDATNVFNTIFWKTILQELCVIGNLLFQLFPLFDPSMPNMFPSFLATSLLGQLSIIHFLLGIGQGDLLVGLLFVLTHFQKLWCSMGCFPSYIFHSLVDDIHIKTI